MVEQKMQALGYDSVRVDSFGNVIGIRIGKHSGPIILFDGHMDVVPATNHDKWTCDPFSGVIKDGFFDIHYFMHRIILGWSQTPTISSFLGTTVQSHAY